MELFFLKGLFNINGSVYNTISSLPGFASHLTSYPASEVFMRSSCLSREEGSGNFMLLYEKSIAGYE